MKTIYLFIVFICLTHATVYSQGCLPEGITFTTQTQIDNFQTNYPGCSVIEGDVVIIGNDISNLNGLNVLDSINGYLRIISNDLLQNLTGLNNLKKIGKEGYGGYLEISENPILSSFVGLESLETVEGVIDISYNISLINLLGLNNLTSIGSRLQIFANDSLSSLTGLENLTFIGGDLLIGWAIWCSPNPMLADISSLSNLTSIGGSLIICGCDSLENLNGLENCSIGDEYGQGNLEIYENASLSDITGIENIDENSINFLNIEANPELSTCEVLSVCNYLALPGAQVNIYSNSTGCNNQEEVEEACESVDIFENDLDIEISISPNPARDIISITCNDRLKIELVNIYSQLGQLVVQEREINRGIDVSNLGKGIYIVEVTTSELKIRQKLIIE